MKKLILLKALLGLTIMVSGQAYAETYYGTAGDDHYSGTSSADIVYGYKGNDDLWSDKGDDKIYGGKHQDFLYGEGGEDKVWGQAGNDHIDAGYPEADYRREVMGGGAGNDTCYSAPTDYGTVVVGSCESRTTDSLGQDFNSN